MKVSFAGGAFTKVTGNDTGNNIWVLKSLDLEGIRGAGSLGDLGRQWGGYGVL